MPEARNGETTGSKPRKRDAEVLEAAADIFYERGYANATIEEVAESLQMLKGSLYYYIKSKEDLLYRLMTEIHDGVDEVLAQVEAVPDLAAIERLQLYVKGQVEYNAQNFKRVSVYYHDIDQLGEARRDEILKRRRTHQDYVTALLGHAQRDGDADPSFDAKLTTNHVFAVIVWMYRWYRPGHDVPITVLADMCATFMRYGVAGDTRDRSPATCLAEAVDDNRSDRRRPSAE